MKKKLIVFGIALIIIIVGLVMAFMLKFNRSLEFGGYTTLNVYMKEASNFDDVKQIVEEAFNGEYEVEYTDEFKDTVTIKLKEASEEQIKQIKDKLVEKYGFEEVENYILEYYVPAIKMFDLIKEYIAPVIISLVIIIVYYGVAFRKLGIVKSVIEPIIIVAIISALYVSAFAICRIPINEYTVPTAILVYILSLLGITAYLNNENQNLIAKK